MTPVSALLSPVSRDCGGGVTGPQLWQQQHQQHQQQQCFVVVAAVLAAVTSVWGVGPSLCY